MWSPFETSSTGELDGTAGSTVTIALPANTGLGSFDNGSSSPLDVGATQVGYCEATDTSTSTPTVTCSVYSGDTIGASTMVTATLNGVTNPPLGSPTLAVSTTSDVTPVTSPPYTVTAAQSVSGVGVSHQPPTSAAGGLTTYVVSFETSSTGELDGAAGSAVTIALPANTGLGSFDNGSSSPLDVGAHPGRLLRSHRHQYQHAHRDLFRLQRGHDRRLDHGDGHAQRGDQSTAGLAHPGRVDHLGRHPGDLTPLHGDRRPVGQRGERQPSPPRPRRPEG